MKPTLSKDSKRIVSREELVEQKLSRFAKLKKLTPSRTPKRPSKRDLDRTFTRLAELLPAPDETGLVEFQLQSARGTPTWTLVLSRGGTQISPEKRTNPDLRIIVGEDDWWQAAQGIVSPISLFMRGKMRFIGDCGIAQRAFAKLAGPGVAKL